MLLFPPLFNLLRLCSRRQEKEDLYLSIIREEDGRALDLELGSKDERDALVLKLRALIEVVKEITDRMQE